MLTVRHSSLVLIPIFVIMKKLVAIIIVIAFSLSCSSGKKAHSTQTINWLTVSQVQEKMKTNPKKVLIDFHTEWCGWCKKMSKHTFTNPRVVNYINENFYAVKFDAESKETLNFLGKTFSNKKRTHDFALNQGSNNGRISFPTIVYYNEKFEKIKVVPGYYNHQSYLDLIKYFGDDHYKKSSFDKYFQ